jgi:transposase
MGAITAARHNATLKAFHQRLIDAGKPKLVAVARKLLTILNAIIRSGHAWQSEVQAASI